ncbi:uracil-DNA glycosylase [Salinibacterium sp. dk2585]|uniref:uracil-DNA glycosylase n=1 Tax=unclassified Salinibacterium TaxID=2632331 RepID=UPI0011C24C9D|nr:MULTISPECIES: uracil-DNA glycosylase [unclassified Salinibacterium]QEE61790.1 uracil-DNA glycosylase [Salinibacterium sp. dk2585]TXK54655.1 uracil-DNA glycosylase [Salinibacterium sp. dk5596]
MTPQRLHELVDEGWAQALEPVASDIATLGERLRQEVAEGAHYLPAGENVLRAFRTPLDAVRVVIVGQDPYPTPGHSIGLAFAVERHVRPLPRSLVNIYRELDDDLGIPPASHGDLSAWADRGVLLLNRVLTVRPGESGSHKGWGWERVTDAALRTLAQRGGPLVAILWGKQAEAAAPLLAGVPMITSAHPSPLSASRGFFGSRPFSRTNMLLEQQGSEGIDWRLE